jgi:hypothetical protein
VPARGYCIALGLLLAIYAFQYLFYGEKWPGSAYERYLFPGVLASHLALLIGAVALLQIARTTWPSKSAVLACQLAMASAFMVPVIDWLTVNRQGSLETVRATQTIDRKFRIVTDALRKNPNMSVIIHSHNVWDLEPAIAIGRFLKADGLDNPVAMKISGYSSDQFPRGSLLNVVAGLSEKLSRGDLDNMTIALAAADTKNCFSIGLSGPPLGYCPHSLKLWPN